MEDVIEKLEFWVSQSQALIDLPDESISNIAKYKNMSCGELKEYHKGQLLDFKKAISILKTNNKEKSQIMQSEQKELERIEFKKRTWKSKFIREHEIWHAIAMQLNSHTGKEYKYWCRVMDLYNEKYR